MRSYPLVSRLIIPFTYFVTPIIPMINLYLLSLPDPPSSLLAEGFQGLRFAVLASGFIGSIHKEYSIGGPFWGLPAWRVRGLSKVSNGDDSGYYRLEGLIAYLLRPPDPPSTYGNYQMVCGHCAKTENMSLDLHLAKSRFT